jgi:2-oxoglutarate dehydrogenase E2 component (dihydrolipoamide succinyltransferase)
MSIEIKIPAVGESITSGVLSAWHKKTGDFVQDGEPIFALETDKISTDVPSPADGKISIQVEAGQEVKIGQVVGSIDETAQRPNGQGGVAPDKESGSKKQPIQASASPILEQSAEQVSPAAIPPPSQMAPQSASEQRNETLSPAARRLVEEEGIPLQEVAGTGKRRQVTKSDLVEYLSKPAPPPETLPAETLASPPPAEAVQSSSSSPASDAGKKDRFIRRKMTPLRKKIAAQLVLAQQNAAMLTTFNECDMTAVITMRSKYQDSFQKRHGVKLGFMSFFVKAVVDALQAVPVINARLDGDDLIENKYYHIGVAVGTDRGLVVPVIRDADAKNFAELERDVANFAGKARDGKLQLDDLTGGVFTITNGGIYGSLLSTPILNPPQSGILGMHKIQPRPVALGDKVEVRPMMYLALSYDHRVVDGREAVTFLVRVKECIEDPSRLLLQG